MNESGSRIPGVEMTASNRARRMAAVLAFAYVLAQTFQAYVLSVLPPAGSPAEELLQGSLSLNLWRAALLLLSFWGLMYVFLVICVQNLKRHYPATIVAFLGFFIFCSLEIGLRSVELFYLQIHLPSVFRQAAGAAEQKAILEWAAGFRSVQMALYFPLLFSQMIGSVILAATFERRIRINYLIMGAMAINALRLLGRILGMFLHVHVLDWFSASLYLPLVYVIFGLMMTWLWLTKKNRAEF